MSVLRPWSDVWSPLTMTLSPANYAQVLLQAMALWSLPSAESFFHLVRMKAGRNIKSHFPHMLLLQKGFVEKLCTPLDHVWIWKQTEAVVLPGWQEGTELQQRNLISRPLGKKKKKNNLEQINTEEAGFTFLLTADPSICFVKKKKTKNKNKRWLGGRGQFLRNSFVQKS